MAPHSNTRSGYLGVDLTSSSRKPSACALIGTDGSLVHLSMERTDEDILTLVNAAEPAVVAIDAPLSLPAGLDCLEVNCPCEPIRPEKGRACDRALRRRGIPLYPATKQTFIKELIYRGIGLANGIREAGTEVVEIYPYASKNLLLGRRPPKKSTREGKEFLRTWLSDLIPGMAARAGELNHDLSDALIGAYTVYLREQGRAEEIGDRAEGVILVPFVP